jgi:nickel-dependent lactate racemase
MSTGLVIVYSANFRPAHYNGEMDQKLRQIAQLYWTEDAARWQLGETKDYASAVALQRIQQQRKELMRSLPLYAIEGGKQ